MAISPRSKKTIGASAAFLRLSYALFPRLSRNITALVIRNYLQQADDIEHTSGNIMRPVDYGTGIDGGWRLKKLPRQAKMAITLFAGLTIGGLLLGKK
jgi:hypothetical protein